jgi:prepilin-type processing-associated H-X9-DG protein
MPPGGEGTRDDGADTAFANTGLTSGTPAPTGMYYHSLFTYLLPYIEQDAIYRQIDQNRYYNDKGAAATHIAAFKNAIKTFVCPSYQFEKADSQGYGYVDYGATVYTDINQTSGKRDPGNQGGDGLAHSRVRGALDNKSPTMVGVTDGTSNTILIAEDAARREKYVTNANYKDPAELAGINVDTDVTGNNTRRFWRWAEQDNGYGVSGDPEGPSSATSTYSSASGGAGYNKSNTGFKIINNNNTNAGGNGPGTSGNCWLYVNNCGPNDEIFSFHTGGAQAVFADGHVAFLRDSLSAPVVAALVSRANGEVNQPID